MGCNCKKKMVLDEAYGVTRNENLLQKSYNYLWKLIMFPIILVLACIIVPILIFSIVYLMVFKKEIKIVPPKFLGKYMK
jgi:hypothetical protein